MNYNQRTCSKAGIKIHETNNNKQYNPNKFNQQSNPQQQSQLYQHDLSISHLSKPVSFQNTTLNTLDLDLDHYSLEDLYHLFNISGGELNESSLKNAKQIVLKINGLIKYITI